MKSRDSHIAGSKPRTGALRIWLVTGALISAALLIEGLVLFLMNNNFHYVKKQINTEVGDPVGKLPSEQVALNLQSVIHGAAINPGSVPKAEISKAVKAAYGNVLEMIEDPDFPAIRMEIRNLNGDVIYSSAAPNVDAKKKRLNHWGNSFLSRDFDYEGQISKEDYKVVVTFVSWATLRKVEDEVQDRVITYRWYALLFTLGNLLITVFLYRYAIRPLARIAHVLESPVDQPPPIIRNPRHTAERAYNRMARGTRLTSVHFDLSDFWEGLDDREIAQLYKPEVFWKPALDVIRRGMGYGCVAWVPVPGEGESSSITLLSGEPEIGAPEPDAIQALFKESFTHTGGDEEGVVVFQSRRDGSFTLGPSNQGDRLWFAGVVRRRGEVVGILMATPKEAIEADSIMLPYFKSLCRQVTLILRRSLERLEEIDRGRYEVSIDLSSSMGHDLTNILATGRLELETIRTAYRRGLVQVPEDKKAAIEESIEGIRKTTVLLQEVVNVYRAFSFTREPHFEQVELRGLVAEVIELYRHSTSRNVKYSLLDGLGEVTAEADPRLLKLVLFNLLANATQAIADRQGEKPDREGQVDIECVTRGDRAILRVFDNGTGFMMPGGQRLEGVELQQVFQFDFTTKARQGGLGLAWVRNIVEDIHHGRLIPSNREDTQGAVMEVRLPQVHKENKKQRAKKK